MTDQSAESPVPLALLLADSVYQDRESGKWIVAGVFSTLNARSMPAHQPGIDLFFQLTNISAPAEIQIRMEHADGETTVLQANGKISANSPLDVLSQKISLRNIPFQRPGKYWVQLSCHDEILIQAPLHVRIVENPPGQAPPRRRRRG